MQISVFYALSVHRTDKTKSYDMIKKLSDIYQSDREYLKVCAFQMSSMQVWLKQLTNMYFSTP